MMNVIVSRSHNHWYRKQHAPQHSPYSFVSCLISVFLLML